jgi:hypothetical protein
MFATLILVLCTLDGACHNTTIGTGKLETCLRITHRVTALRQVANIDPAKVQSATLKCLPVKFGNA